MGARNKLANNPGKLASLGADNNTRSSVSRGFKASQKIGFGNQVDDEGNKSTQAGQDYIINENEESAAENAVTNIGRTEEATEGKDGSLKSVETTTEKTEVVSTA